MKHAKMFGWTILVIGVALCAVQGRSVASAKCHPISGRMSVAQVTEGCPLWCSRGTILGGRLDGTVALSLTNAVGGTNPTSVAYDAARTYTAGGGTLTVQESGLVDGGQRRFAAFGVVTRGTGVFANASGTIFVYGYSNAAGTEYEGNLGGEICGVGGEDD